jgi:hypothetical protein
MSLASLLLAAAVLITVNSPQVRVWAGLVVPTGRRRRVLGIANDPLAAASSLDVLAACLSSGMPVSRTAAAAASSAPAQLSRLLSRAADLLVLGADPATAWSNPSLPLDNHAEALLRLARRSASSGPALAHGLAELATQSRHDAADAAGSGSSTRVGADRRAAGPVLSAGVSVLGHRPGRRRVGRRCAGAGPDGRADCPPAVSRTGRPDKGLMGGKGDGRKHDSGTAARMTLLAVDEAGMSTVEYSVVSDYTSPGWWSVR